MKITKEHYEHLENEIEKYFVANGGRDKIVYAYEHGLFVRSENVKDLQTRFNFDVFHFAGLTRYACDELYSYVNDTHIATALKRICPKVTRKY